jgi:hypothetical protein
MFKKNLVVYKNNLWVTKYKYKNNLHKFQNELRSFAYESLLYMSTERGSHVRRLIYVFFFIIAFKYIRYNYVNRNRDLMRTGVTVHEAIMGYEIDPPKDPVDANNYNKLHYSKQYTLKY